MPKRKLAKDPSTGDSDLSPAPEGLLDEKHERVINGHTNQERPEKKRKGNFVKTEVVEKDANGATVRNADGISRGITRKKGKRTKDKEIDDGSSGDTAAPKKTTRSRRQPITTDESKEVEIGEGEHERPAKEVKRRKKTEEADAMPLTARTIGHKLYIGAHVSGAGGVQNSVANSVHIGANAFALFLKSQRKWANPALADDQCSAFRANCEHHAYDQARHVVPHGSYLVNLAHTDPARTEQAYEAFIDDLRRCERLGITLYNFHPGNSVGNDRAAAIAHLASNLNRAHRETIGVVTLLENMAGGGNVLGSTFEDLRDIVALVDRKDRVGVCLDTCHAFAAGYDLRTPCAFKETMDRFNDVVGFEYLRALHLNDSKAPFASHRDLHANVGTGFLGLRGFHNIVNETRFAGLPLVLETPIVVRDENGHPVKDEKGKEKEDRAIWAREIKLLESMVGMDVESEEFLELESRLAKQGEPEREKLTEQQERKRGKEEKMAKSTRKRNVARKVPVDDPRIGGDN